MDASFEQLLTHGRVFLIARFRGLPKNGAASPSPRQCRFPDIAIRQLLSGVVARNTKGIMKLLLTSAGVRNPSIHDALVGLLGKPIADCNALCIPTALYGHPMGTPAGAWRFISGQSGCPMCELGWKSVGVLELTRAAQHRSRALGALGPGGGCPAGGGRRCRVSGPLDAPVGPRGPAAVAGSNRLGGTERRKHGDDASRGGGVRRDEAVHHGR